MRNKYQKEILSILGTKPILYNPDLARKLGSVKAGIFLSQLLYWHEKGRNPEWTYKTIDEIKEELALTRKEQDAAIKICKDKKVIEVKLKGMPAKRHFRINIDNIIKLLMEEIKIVS